MDYALCLTLTLTLTLTLIPEALERGLCCAPHTVPTVNAAIVCVQKIKFYNAQAFIPNPIVSRL